MELAGFDIQFTGDITFEEKDSLLTSFLLLIDNDFNKNNYQNFFNIFNKKDEIFKGKRDIKIDYPTDKQEISKTLQELVKQKIDIYSVGKNRNDLEKLFLSITNNN